MSGLSLGPRSESSDPDDRPILATALALYCARARRKISGIAPSMRLWPAVRVLSAAVGQRCAQVSGRSLPISRRTVSRGVTPNAGSRALLSTDLTHESLPKFESARDTFYPGRGTVRGQPRRL